MFLRTSLKFFIVLIRPLSIIQPKSRKSSLAGNEPLACVPSYVWATDNFTLQDVLNCFELHENFISSEEENSLMDEIDAKFKRRRYEYDHWDGAIQGYKETENMKWNETNQAVLKRLRDAAFPPGVAQLQHVHVLDLAEDGFIKPHIDSVRFCGDTIAGISLMSSSVMRLVNERNKPSYADVLLHRRSLYIMKAEVRYKYTHEILEDKASFFKGKHIPRERRVSIICRNEPSEAISR